MKRFYIWIAAMLLMFTLCGCQEHNTYDITYDGKTYTVDREQRTVTVDEVVYQFAITRNGEDSVDLDIIYPDGSRYYWSQSGFMCGGGWSPDYDPETKGYVPGDVLWDVLGIRPSSQDDFGTKFLLVFLLLAVGAFLVITPQTAWMAAYGWRFKDAEPSDFALIANRVSGVALICFGIICLLVI